MIGQLQLLNKEEKDSIEWKEIRENALILTYDLDPNVKKVKFLYKLLGYNLMTLILKMYFLK